MDAIRINKVIQQNKHHYHLQLSNGEEIEIHEDLLVRYRLLAGKEIDPHLLQELNYEGEIQRGYSMAINFLSYRPRSLHEVRQHLLRKEINKQYIDVIVERLLEKKYLDDAQFAQKWVNDRLRLKPKGKFALAAELREKGISSSIIQDVLSTIDQEIEIEQAIKLGEKKLRQWQGRDWFEVRNKLLRFLTSKGYEMDVIMRILPKLEEEFRNLA